ncbi:hypothetical protein [Prauserella aidingensis]|uniref:hypothetical protein n=1 Tax=Prauserella aidingensis TaxID=387890 RepID=UPI0020A3B9C9|nr:hypothetical protein [Prauserella aidingensis]
MRRLSLGRLALRRRIRWPGRLPLLHRLLPSALLSAVLRLLCSRLVRLRLV